ncbi:MAG: ABC transporter ATP-binding protein/permease [Lactobacillaceae bacterium]|jgi:ATP-binding cassette subfamily B protein AbcA/BmrA|nr:ABC transporter ATP-binding protein/permease [Lactobacillaceae bacterium]
MTKIKLINISLNFVFGIFLAILAGMSSIFIPLQIRNIIDGSQVQIEAILILISLFIIQIILSLLGTFLLSRNSEQNIKNTTRELYRKSLLLPSSFFDIHNSVELSTHESNDLSAIKEFQTQSFPSMVIGLATIISSVSALFYLDWKLTLVVIVMLPIMFLLITPFGSLMGKLEENARHLAAINNSFIAESFKNIKAIKLNNAQIKFNLKMEDNTNLIYKNSVKSDLVASFVTPVMYAVIFATVGIIFLYGGKRVAANTLSIGTLVSFLIYLFQLLNPFSNIANFFNDLSKARSSVSAVEKIFETPDENIASGVGELEDGDIRLEDIYFSYENDLILENVTLQIPLNKKIAFVGPSGGGKTTLINLVSRLYAPTSGNLKMGKVDARVVNLNAWRSKFSVVSQEDYLFQGTLKENLLLGVSDEVSDEDIEHALKKAQLFDELDIQGNGLNLSVSESGGNFSGGQKQRIQIARAMLRNTPFLILDEATSALDSESEFKINKALNEFSKGNKTIIAVAHRLSTIQDSDTIFFVDEKKITGFGKHGDLLRTHEKYRQFINDQTIK